MNNILETKVTIRIVAAIICGSLLLIYSIHEDAEVKRAAIAAGLVEKYNAWGPTTWEKP